MTAATNPNPGFQKRGKEKNVKGIILIIINEGQRCIL